MRPSALADCRVGKCRSVWDRDFHFAVLGFLRCGGCSRSGVLIPAQSERAAVVAPIQEDVHPSGSD